MDAPRNVVDAEPAVPDDQAPADPPFEAPSDRVLLGVAGHIADLLGVDALWVRLAFVVLALTGGIGIVLYVAAWLVLFGPDRTGMDWVSYLGGAIALIVVPIIITDGDLEFYDGPVAVVALLIGLTLALWQPRNDTAERRPARLPLPPPLGRPSASTIVAPTDDVDDVEPDVDESPAGSDRWARRVQRPVRRRPRPEPSILGRATLGCAVIVAAAGALIDQFNGGRLHPEQWLGAAAVICGVGLLVGVVRGRAWWLIGPALLFAGTGYVAGLMSRLGIDAVDTFGDQSLYVSDTTPGGTATLQTGFGSVWITVDGTPADPLVIDARAAFGPVELRVVDDVAIEVRSESDAGDLIVDGIAVPSGVTRLGPDGPPGVIVDARQGIGDTVVFTYFPDDRVPATPPKLPVDDPVVPPVRPVPDVDVVPPDPTATTAPPAPSTTIGD